MGLFIQTGTSTDTADEREFFKDSLETINEVLNNNNIKTYNETEITKKIINRAPVNGFPYSYLHHLRRFYAYTISKNNWDTYFTTKDENPVYDQILEDEVSMLDSHLLCHSDAEGYYIPVRLDDVLFDEDIPGGILCSSYNLFDELIMMAPKLNIKLEDKKLSDKEVERILNLIEKEDKLSIEYTVWLSLYEAARLSIENKITIFFL